MPVAPTKGGALLEASQTQTTAAEQHQQDDAPLHQFTGRDRLWRQGGLVSVHTSLLVNTVWNQVVACVINPTSTITRSLADCIDLGMRPRLI